jgi:hypothetical protein
VSATGADCRGTTSSQVALVDEPTAEPDMPRNRQKTTPAGRSRAGAPRLPWTSKLAMTRVQARSAQISIRAPSEPAPSCHWNVGERDVENAADAGATGRGAATSTAASSPASATLPCEDALHAGAAAARSAGPRRRARKPRVVLDGTSD